MSIFWPVWFAAFLGWLIGKAMGLPAWTGWDTPDRTDIALVMAALVWTALRYLRQAA